MDKRLRVRGPPASFWGNLRLPPSKSYMHRALFVASLGTSSTKLTGCGENLANDILATIETIRAFGSKIVHNNKKEGTLKILPCATDAKKISIFTRGSGTTARFAIAYAALAKEGVHVKISGDTSLSMRPMQAIFESLQQLGVECSFDRAKGKLPITVRGGGIEGGDCWVDGSISSQFISSLLISCTRARRDCTIRIRKPKSLVSRPYIEATLSVLSHFGLVAKSIENFSGFMVKGNQVPSSRDFEIPADMSAAAAIICSTLAAGGESKLLGVNSRFPQSDARMIAIGKSLGATIKQKKSSLSIAGKLRVTRAVVLDLNDAPDLVPALAGLAAASGLRVRIANIGHLKFKESDRLAVLARELSKLGIRVNESDSSIELGAFPVSASFRKPILLDPEKDHRMLMAFTIAGLSGRYGEIVISDPDCVSKSYPNFVKDLQYLCHEKKTLRIVGVKG